MVSESTLAAQIRETRRDPDANVLWWAGQHGFVLCLGGTVLGIDLYLKDEPRRLVPPVLRPDETAVFDALLGTHDHADHIDPSFWPELARRDHGPALVAPEHDRARLSESWAAAPGRLHGARVGERLRVGAVEIWPIPAAHEQRERDPETRADRFLGYALRTERLCVYHAGDTVPFEGLEPAVRGVSPDVMLLPINGRDGPRYRRGIVGNMTYQEAGDLADRVSPALVIPTHYDMHEANRADPEQFVDYLAARRPDLRVRVPAHGEAVDLSGCARADRGLEPARGRAGGGDARG